jgi:hypothetical protein
MICHDKQFIFIHCQKCGGESIEHALTGKADVGYNGDLFEGSPEKHWGKQNYIDAYGKEVWNNYFTFSFVRNPWERMISWICYRDKRFNLYNGKINKDILIKEISMRPEHTSYVNMLGLLDSDSKQMDFIGKVENMQNDFEYVCDRLRIPRILLPHNNKSNHNHYSEYYDNETVELVANKYSKDIEMFGYSFESGK